MRMLFGVVATIATMVASDVLAQGANLTGRWRCVELCLGPPGSYAYITQNGWELNVVNDAGEPSRAWVDYPGRILGRTCQSRGDLFPRWQHPAV